MAGQIREPAVAGSFYPASKEKIFKALEFHLGESNGLKGTPLGAISPHAGWVYSGPVAGAVFGSIEVPDNVILVGPNHHGLGAKAAIDSSDGWSFPFGTVPVNAEIAGAIADDCPDVRFDAVAHAYEHSIEVIVPFLYARNPAVKIVPVSLFTDDADTVHRLGSAIAAAVDEYGAMVVASTDMTHFLPDDQARKIDADSIKIIESMNYQRLLGWVKTAHALCGGTPVAVLLKACGDLGASRAELLKYATSGDTGGSRESVVGYGGFIVA
jgi:AmmeMemoRadiSam system protein B